MDAEQLLAKLKTRELKIIGESEYRRSAILIPLIEKNDEIHLLFEVRSLQMRSQPGDVCFPGGMIDESDPSPKYSAIRETTEELGITSTEIEDVIPFDYVVSDIGAFIYPFIGKIRSLEKMVFNEAEVEEVFTVPLRYFIENEPATFDLTFQPVPADDFPYELIYGGENYNWRPRGKKEYFYQYDGKVIWGLTANIVRHLVKTIGQELLIDEKGVFK